MTEEKKTLSLGGTRKASKVNTTTTSGKVKAVEVKRKNLKLMQKHYKKKRQKKRQQQKQNKKKRRLKN